MHKVCLSSKSEKALGKSVVQKKKGVVSQRVTAGALAVLSALSVQSTAYAKELKSAVLTVKQGIDIYYNNLYFIPKDAQDRKVESFIYNGTTYVPARALSNLFGHPIRWDGSDNSMHIDLTEDITSSGTFSAAYDKEPYTVDIEAKLGVTLYVKDKYGEKQVLPTDVNGKEVPIIFSNGTNYLPLRAVSSIFGQEVAWNSDFQGVIIGNYDESVAQKGAHTEPPPKDVPVNVEPSVWQAYQKYLYYLGLLEPYNPIISERQDNLNYMGIDCGVRLERLNLDLSDPVLKAYHDEYYEIIAELFDLYVRLGWALTDGYREAYQDYFQHIENGTYTNFERDVVVQGGDFWEEQWENLSSNLEAASDENIEIMRKKLTAILDKMETYQKQKKFVS